MKIKRIIVLLLLSFFIFNMFCEEDETPQEEPAVELTEEQQKLFEDYGDRLDRFDELNERQLNVFVDFGDKKQKETALNILRYREQRDKFNNMIEALKAQLASVPQGLPETFSATNGIQGLINQKIDELYALELQRQNDKADAKEISKIYLASRNSQKKGDPVKITRGSYEQNEIDFTIGSVQIFTVNRNYDSESKIYSSFGYGWSTNLDERIILGLDPGAEEIYITSCELLKTLESKIQEQRQGILETYEVTSVDSGAEEINRKFDELIEGYENLRAQAYEYSFHDYVSYAEGMKKSLKDQKETLLGKFNEDVSVLNTLTEQYNAEKTLNLEKKIKKEKSLSRKKVNEKAMFEGMDSSYEDTGLNTITVIDEGGYPHILTEIPDSVWKNETDRSISECRKLTDGKYEVVMADGTVKQYDKSGFIIKITDRNSNCICWFADGCVFDKQSPGPAFCRSLSFLT